MPTSDNFDGTIEVVAPTGGCVVGTVYLIENVVGLCLKAAAAGALAVLKIEGKIKDAVKHGATAGQAWAAGDNLYWDNTNKRFTTTSTSNTLIAKAAAAATTAATSGDVILFAR